MTQPTIEPMIESTGDREYPGPVERPDPPYVAAERPMLEAWLDFHRMTLRWKCAGLTGAQLATRSVPPSNLSLLGLLRHLAEVERSWFRRTLAGEDAPALYYSDENPDGDLDDLDPAQVDAALATYDAEVAAARAVAASYDSLDAIGAVKRHGVQDVSLRWIFMHMIEEYARHNGHADLLREAIDGMTGE
jgi:uncharacterized damage-inducible protein DinB